MILSVYGVSQGPDEIFLSRLFGAALIGIGLLTWLARNITNRETQRAIILSMLVYDKELIKDKNYFLYKSRHNKIPPIPITAIASVYMINSPITMAHSRLPGSTSPNNIRMAIDPAARPNPQARMPRRDLVRIAPQMSKAPPTKTKIPSSAGIR